MFFVKRVLKIIWKVIASIAASVLALALLTQAPPVQTFAVRRVLAALEGSIPGKIEFSQIHLRPFNAVVLKDVVILDPAPDTLRGEVLDTMASARTISATFSLKGLARKEGLRLSKARVTDGQFMIVSDSGDSNLKRVFNFKKKENKPKEPGNVLFADKVRIQDFRFRLVNPGKFAETGYGINWQDLDVFIDHLDGKKLSVSGGYVSGEVNELTFKEKSGYIGKSLSGKAKVGHGETVVEGLRILDQFSDIRLPLYKMSYENTGSFSDFLHQVRITAVFEPSVVDFESISFFAPTLRGRNTLVEVRKGDVDGPVNDMDVTGLDFLERNSGVSGTLTGKLSGLPTIKDFSLILDARNLRFTTAGLGKVLKNWAPGLKVDFSKFAHGETLVFNGSVGDLLNDMKVKGEISSGNLGSLNADIGFEHLVDKEAVALGGNISTKGLDLGRIANVRQLGPCTMRSTLRANLGGDGVKLRIDSLFVDRLNALDYDYSNIIGNGTYSQNAFDGRILCDDPNLNFIFQGLFTLSDKTKNGLYNFIANIGYADLYAIKLDKRGLSKVSGQVKANYMNVDGKELLGDIDISGLSLENAKGRHDIGDIILKSHSNNDIHRINIKSSFLDGSYVGMKPVLDIVDDIKQLTISREIPALLKSGDGDWDGETYDISLQTHDSRDILSFVFPGLYIADRTSIKLNVNEEGTVTASVKSPRLAKDRNYLKDLDLALDNKDGRLNGSLRSSEMNVASLNLRNNDISMFAKDNHVGIGFSYDNQSEKENKGEFYFEGDLDREDEGKLVVNGKTLPSGFFLDGDYWSISQSAFAIEGKDFSVDELSAICDDLSFTVDGGFSKSKADTLAVEFQKFNISLIDKIFGQNLGLGGAATGRALVVSSKENAPGLLLNLRCDSTSVGGHDMGVLHLGSSLGNDENGNKLHVILRNNLKGKRTLDVEGDYSMNAKSVDMRARLSDFNIGYASSVLESVFSELEGSISGEIRATGPFNALKLSSQGTRFDGAKLRVAFTNVPYTVDGPFHIDEKGLYFDNDSVTDRFDGRGTVSGGLIFNDFKDIRLDTRISLANMEALNTTLDDNPTFHGHVFATGNVSIYGPFNGIQMDIDARTVKDGSFRIPLANASGDKNSDLLTFKEYEDPEATVFVDPYELMMANAVNERKKKSEFALKLRVNATPGVQAFVEIDRDAGNVLTGRGQGIIDLTVRPAIDLFSINGDYTIREGNFHFNAMDIAQRDFTINDGSSIRFNGDIMDSDLSISGLYTTKASVATLIADTSSVSSRKVVNCGIGVSGKLREPSLSFSIDIPDVDPTTKAKVESALNTEDKVQRQLLSLLISGTFMPDEQSGIVNNTSTLYSSVAEIMAGQLNNILDKLNIPLDLGLNYQASESGTNIFDVAVSTQLFNDRVIVNGAFGNRDYRSGEADVVGDLDIEVKLDKAGRLRLNLFSHSADDYTNYLDNTQRNGVGIAYQKEFVNFKELIKNMFTSRKKRENAAAGNMAPKEMKTIKIDE